jgi:hypothetical protein
VLPVDLEDTVAGWRAWSLPTRCIRWRRRRPAGDARGLRVGEDWVARRMERTLNEITATGATHVTLDSLWVTEPTAPGIRFDFEASPLPADVAALATAAQARTLKIALRPIPCRGPGPDCGYWSGTVFSVEGWGRWFETYRNFLLYHADLAERIGADMLYVGDYSLHPMLPGAPEASPDAETQWRALLDEVRQHYHGQLAFTVLLQDAQTTRGMPLFGDALDYIDVRWEAPLAASNPASLEEMQATAGVLIDTKCSRCSPTSTSRLGSHAAVRQRHSHSVRRGGGSALPRVRRVCQQPRRGQRADRLNQQAMAYHAAVGGERPQLDQRLQCLGLSPVALRDRGCRCVVSPPRQ